MENHAHAATHDMANHADHAHHHEHPKLSFIEKYVFSMDHKIISKQFLFTAMFMALAAAIMSTLFRLQLAWPGHSFPVMHYFLGDRWAKGGILDQNMYLGMITIHGTIMVFFLLTGGLSGTFANLLIPLQVGARDMASPMLNMLSSWFFLLSSIVMLISLGVESGPASAGWTIY